MRNHVLKIVSGRCGMTSTCWYGTCSCGEWTKGPHFMPETLQAYWADHVHLTCEAECPLHGGGISAMDDYDLSMGGL